MELTRLIVTKPDGTFVGDVDPSRIVDVTFVHEVNGEHSLTLVTFDEYTKNDRLLWCDEMGVWHENVVEGAEGEHGEHGDTLHTYWCPWSLQHDLSGTFVTEMPGTGGIPVPAATALGSALSGTERWQVGTVTRMATGGASMWRMSGWEALQVLVETWGGELSVTIVVGVNGVVERYVNLLEQVGATVATRRFDYGGDVMGIKRTVSDQPWTCRIIPLGKAQQTDGGGYGRKVTIEDANGGVIWLQNDDVVGSVRVPDGNGGWEYPTQVVENGDIDDPAKLKAWALEHIAEWTTPKASYEVDVMQLVAAGTDATGVSEGDSVAIVDRDFAEDGLVIVGRALRIEGSLLDPTQTTLTISNLGGTLGGQLDSIARSVATLEQQQQATSLYQATATYLSNLITRLNAEINATGGYWYMVPGLGTRTYDREVSDPAVGAEASKVVEIKGGTIRIADSRTSGGDWNWKTVFTSGHILADLVTAANLTAGYIGSAESGSYWNLDTGVMRISAGGTLGDRTVQQALNDIDATITGVDVEYAQGDSATQAPQTGWATTAPAWQSGKYIWSRTATTTAGSSTPEYSTPVMISGRDGTDGTDGTSVTIKGSYDTLAQLQAAHPTGSDGDAYMVGADLYVWNGSEWENVGQIQGPQGPAGQNGTSVTISKIEYGTSNSASTQPSSGSWSTTPPTSIAEGKWLWVKTTYSDGNTATTKSYIGTDGTDGTSVYITSTSKTGDTTTVRFSDGKTISIKDGEDGANGQPGPAGADGESTYIHVAWANSQDGTTDFSTTVSTGKSYLGVCTDQNTADPTTPSSYSWSKIEGAAGAEGVGVSQVIEQYYLSTSSSTLDGGSWSVTPPAYVSGRYYWTRSRVRWTDGSTTYTTAVLARGLNSANSTAASASTTANTAKTTANSASSTASAAQTTANAASSTANTAKDTADAAQSTANAANSTANTAKSTADAASAAASNAQSTADAAQTAAYDAAKVATDYLTFNSTTGLEVGYSATRAKTRVSTSGVEVFNASGSSAIFAGTDNNKAIVRVGVASDAGNIVMSEDGYISLRYGATTLAYFGYGPGVNGVGGTSTAPYFTIGTRKASSAIGNYSVAEGYGTSASWYSAHAEGQNTSSSSNASHSEGNATQARAPYSHAEGNNTKAGPATPSSGQSLHGQHAEGAYTQALGECSHAEGYSTIASGLYSHAQGYHTAASGESQFVFGSYNVEHSTTDPDSKRMLIMGIGADSLRKTGAYLTYRGNMWISGTLTQASDRRLKEHHKYLGDDAAEFVRKLRPALFTKDGARHVGFYAQDVQGAEPEDWDTVTVTETEDVDEGLDFNPLQLDYTALIAPLVAYCQQLEKRIEALEKEVR